MFPYHLRRYETCDYKNDIKDYKVRCGENWLYISSVFSFESKGRHYT